MTGPSWRADQVKRRLIVSEPQDDLLTRLLKARSCSVPDPVQRPLAHLLSGESMLGLQSAARLLAKAKGKITVVADYDCDGATACALAVRGLRALKPDLEVTYHVPNRLSDGYGLSTSVVQKIIDTHQSGAEHCLLTVDNGIASVEGVRLAKAKGLGVIITDHHLPGPTLPDADAIVNPNQPGCQFPSKSLAGVGVMFYLLIALRAHLRSQNSPQSNVNLQQFVDLVAIGTVADLVTLDANNRVLVQAGLQQLRSGRGNPGLLAITRCAARAAEQMKASDLGFIIGPRINAAGRLESMRQGIDCLLEDDPQVAAQLAQALEAVNQDRKQRQAQAVTEALNLVPRSHTSLILVAHNPDWHEGIVGLVASRLKEDFQRPAFAFAAAQTAGVMKGSGRSVAGLHLRDMLDYVSKAAPDLLLSFGGHAMAAGLSLRADRLAEFEQLIGESADYFVRQNHLSYDALKPQVMTDGPLEGQLASPAQALTLALAIEQQIWGQGFPEPLFDDEFELIRQELVGDKHLRAELRLAKTPQLRFRAMQFFSTEPLQSRQRLLYHLTVNRWNGKVNAELLINSAID